ncbi:MAG: TAXI family TRAP transporter solute-binding subunit, partial [Hyphomicrobiales bacterium]
ARDLDFGFVQSDWLHHAFHGTAKFAENEPFGDFRSVFALHNEVATVVVAADSDYYKFDDLKGARVNIGASGSGSAATWRTVIDGLGWSDTDQKQLSALKASTLADALCSGRIDAYFILIGHPAGLIEDTIEQCGIRLLGFDEEEVTALLDEHPYYRPVTIPVGNYGLSVPVSSFGVVATFVTSEKMSEDIVSTLVSTLYDNFDYFRNLHPALGEMTRNELANLGSSVPVHPGAMNFYRERQILTEDKVPSEN